MKMMLRRNLHYWGKTGRNLLGIIFLTSLFMLVFVGIQAVRWKAPDVRLEMLQIYLVVYPYYLMIACLLITAIYGINSFCNQLMIPLAMGAGRKESLLGMHLMFLGLDIIIWLIGLIMWLITGPDVLEESGFAAGLLLGVLLATTGISLLMGNIRYHLGRLGLLASIILLAAAGVIMGVFMSSGKEEMLHITWVFADFPSATGILLVCAGVLIYLAAFAINYVTNRHMEMKW